MLERARGVYLGAVTESTPTPIDPAATSGGGRPLPWLWIAMGVVAVIRTYFCWQPTVNSGDVVRHLLHSFAVLQGGLSQAGVPLQEIDPDLAGSTWSAYAYNYPPVALAFFALVAALAPAVTAVKFALTLVEAVNAWLLTRITGNRWLGLLYWASPLSIWWVSGEGQFEPLQAVFMLGAIHLLKRKPALAMALLGLGVQVKLTAVLLLPWMAWQVWKGAGAESASAPADDSRQDSPASATQGAGQRRALAAAAFAVAFLPTLVASLSYDVMGAITSTFGTLRYNPYYWAFWDPEIFRWNPGWLVATNAVATWAAMGALLWFGWRSKDRLAYLAPILFLVLLKTSSLGQFWYLLLFPAFVAPIPERSVRAWLIGLTPLMDVRSLIQLVWGPFGFTVGGGR